jgi:elongator complex protein 1
VYEEEYLINSLSRLIERVNTVNEDVSRLVEGLMRRGKREQARVVESAMVEVAGLCNAMINEVYEIKPDELIPKEDRPTGGESVLMNALETAQKPKVAPVIKAFERLSLLE